MYGEGWTITHLTYTQPVIPALETEYILSGLIPRFRGIHWSKGLMDDG